MKDSNKIRIKRTEENIYTLKAEILQAIAQPTRLKILEYLRDGEKCVCELFPAIGEQQSNVSRHLAILRKYGILMSRKERQSIYYRVRDENIFKIIDLTKEILRKFYLEKGRLIHK